MKTTLQCGLAIATLAAAINPALADAVTDWNRRAGELMTEARVGTPVAVRVSAIVQTSVLDALAALAPSADASATDAAVAAADPVLPSGTLVTLVSPDGERSFLTDRGANLALASADLPDAPA